VVRVPFLIGVASVLGVFAYRRAELLLDVLSFLALIFPLIFLPWLGFIVAVSFGCRKQTQEVLIVIGALAGLACFTAALLFRILSSTV
jgi:hypothetical protein